MLSRMEHEATSILCQPQTTTTSRQSISTGSKLITIPIQLLDIPDICLERIFSYCQYRDLINLADTSSVCRIIAQNVYRIQYKNCIVCISPPWNDKAWIESTNYKITLRTLLSTLRSLRCFGIYLRKLAFQYPYMSNKYIPYIDLVMQYIQSFCSHIEHIQINGPWTIDVPFFQLPHVVKLDICNADLGA